MTDEVCPACGYPLDKYGCKNVEQVGSFCRGPAPSRAQTAWADWDDDEVTKELALWPKTKE